MEDPSRRIQVLRQQIREFQPDWVLVSCEDLGHGLLREAQHSAPGRVVYLAHTPQFFPFGPASWNPDREAAALVADAAGVVAIGHHMADYIARTPGREAVVIHPPIYGAGPFADYANFDAGLVIMINPCAVKGFPSFSKPPRASLNRLRRAAGLGHYRDDRHALAAPAQCRVSAECAEHRRVLAAPGVLLMPSLWYEGFGLIVMESMLHGIPVIASDSGGLVEAKHGTPFVIPVHTIERYEPVFDEHGMPRPVVRENDPTPWVAALRELLTDRAPLRLRIEASLSRRSALSPLDAAEMERYLLHARPRPAAHATIESLSPESAHCCWSACASAKEFALVVRTPWSGRPRRPSAMTRGLIL